MTRRPTVAGLVAVVVAFLSGCLGTAAPAAHDHLHMHEAEIPFEMTATGCEEGGFVAVVPLGSNAALAEKWMLTDIREEVGKPMRSGVGTPMTGEATGNWHMGFRCASAETPTSTQKDFIFGYVGDWIKAPAWDVGGADAHILVSGLGFGNGSIADSLRLTTTAAISHAYPPTGVTWFVPKEMPRSAVHAIYSDVEKGIYLSYSEMSKYRDVAPRTIRIWWQVPANGTQAHASHDHGATAPPEPGTWHPVYWDLVTSGGAQFTTPPVDSPEVGCHAGTNDHGPQGGLCQPTLTNIYEHNSLRFTSGHVIPDVTLSQIWVH